MNLHQQRIEAIGGSIGTFQVSRKIIKKMDGMIGDANLSLTVTHRAAGAYFVYDRSNVC